jgi:RNA polymerase sigma factor (TIGR02999 family)
MPSTSSDDFTLLLNRATNGDGQAADLVWSHAYDEMQSIARRVRPAASASSAHAPSPTTIIHESFMKTFGRRRGAKDATLWDSRAHFFGSVARAMGQFVVDWRRTESRRKRGGGQRPVCLEAIGEPGAPETQSHPSFEEIADFSPRLVAALERLRSRAPEIADVVWMRAMAGLSLEDTAIVLGIRPRTVSKRWNLGRALLRRDLSRGPDADVADERIAPGSA